MLHPRIIPMLLVKNKGLVKTTNFKDPKYVGDPINAVKIFNEKEVDELIVLDIEASSYNNEPNYQMIKNLAFESRMPLCYGGGIKSIDQLTKIIKLGVEKVSICSSALFDTDLVKNAVEVVGGQSVVITMDIKKARFSSKYMLFSHGGTKVTDIDPIEYAQYVSNIGVGEIVVNSIDRDGTMKGYDMELIRKIKSVTKNPITAVGGAGALNDIALLFKTFGTIGAAAGSLFVFKGKYRAVLINYPSQYDKKTILTNK